MADQSPKVVPIRPRRRRAHLDEATVRGLMVGERVWDDSCGGLYAERGRRKISFRIAVAVGVRPRRRLAGVPRVLEITLGHFPDMSARKARTEAQRIKGEVAAGRDPRVPGEEDGVTVARAWEMFEAHLKRRSASARTLRTYKFAHARLKPLHASLLSAIALDRTGLMQREHDRMAARNGAAAARDSMEFLGRIYRHAARSRDLPQWRGGAYTAAPRVSRSRDRRIAENDLPAWRARLERVRDPQKRALLIFMLLSSLRERDAVTLRWDCVNLCERYARIPEPKGGLGS